MAGRPLPSAPKTLATLAVTCFLAGFLAIWDVYLDAVVILLGSSTQGQIVGTTIERGSRGTQRHFVEIEFRDAAGQTRRAHSETSKAAAARTAATIAAGRRVEASLQDTSGDGAQQPMFPAVRVAVTMTVDGWTWSGLPNRFALKDDDDTRKTAALVMLGVFAVLAAMLTIIGWIQRTRPNRR